MTAEFNNREVERDMSIRGIVNVHDITYSVWALLFDEVSDYGINGGRISKLTISCDGFKRYFSNGTIYDYDRNTWNTYRSFPHVLNFAIKELESQPKKFKTKETLTPSQVA